MDFRPVTCVNCILYNQSTPYEVEMKRYLEKYLSSVQGIHSFYFYCFDESISEMVVDEQEHLVRFPGKEEFVHGILDKTLRIFDWVLSSFPEVQYIVRSNISTVIDFSVFLPHLKEVARRQIDYCGPWLFPSAYWIDERSGYTAEKRQRFGAPPFVSGTCIVLSRKAAQNLIDNQHVLLQEIEVVDDLAIGIYFYCHSVASKQFRKDQWPVAAPCIYRNKRENREDDVAAIRELCFTLTTR